MARSKRNTIRWARRQIRRPSKNWYRLCLQFVRLAFDVHQIIPDAGKSWDRSRYKHRTNDPSKIPAGVPVYWEMASVADHVALSTGKGRCISNDIKRRGKIDEVQIDLITRAWGGKLLGWTEDINGVRVWDGKHPKPKKKKAKAKKPTVDLSRLRHAARRDPGLPQGGTTYPAGVKHVERALRAEGHMTGRYSTDGSFGSATVSAYAKYQRSLGYRGKDADGIPGYSSLKKLGRKHGFKVTR